MKHRKKLKDALEEVRLATRVAREWDEKRVLRAIRNLRNSLKYPRS